jgi:hypothetical protein
MPPVHLMLPGNPFPAHGVAVIARRVEDSG